MPAALRTARVSSGGGAQESSSPGLVLYQWEPRNVTSRSESLRVSQEALWVAVLLKWCLQGEEGEGEEGTGNHPSTRDAG